MDSLRDHPKFKSMLAGAKVRLGMPATEKHA
jgi:hypothetical protein